MGPATLVLSSSGSIATTGDAGQVALRRRDVESSEWLVEAILAGINKPGSGHGAFGSSISGVQLPSGEELVFIGAQNGGNLNGPVREGSAYAFVRSPANPPGPGAWEMEERILAPDGIEGDQFGTAVGLLPTPGLPGGHAGDALAVVGAPEHREFAHRAGAVYAYTRAGSTGVWSYVREFVPDDLADFDYFGDGISLMPLPDGVAGEVLALIGSRGDNDLTTRSGAAYAFRREYVAVADTFRWVEEDKLLPELPSLGHEFGAAAALTADTLADGTPVVLALVGNKLDEFTDGFGHPGEASLFVRSTATGEAVWTRRAVYQTGEPYLNPDWFGHAVAFARTEEGPLALVGAYRSDAAFEMGHPNGQNAGAVFVYDASVTTAGQPEDPQQQTSLAIYPNPARGTATAMLHLEASGHVRVALYDALGREVAIIHDAGLTAGTHRLSITANRLSAGVYVVRARGDFGLSETATVTVIGE